MKSKLIYIIGFIFLKFFLFSQELIHIGILGNYKINHIKFFSIDNYSVQFDDGNELFKLNKNQFYEISSLEDSVILFDNLNGKKIQAKKIVLYPSDISVSEFSIFAPKLKKERTYKGQLKIYSFSGNLNLINSLDIDDYVCGVVNAEVGKGKHIEFYKAQALLVRTYALSHLYKHQQEGFNLCDQVHCQVYNGTCLSSNILESVKNTHNLVIVDKDLNLIVAAFHSNSGGQTVNSEDIWGSKKNYLRSIKDTFSIGMPSYRWRKKLPLDEWLKYLKKYNYPVTDSDALKNALNFKQSTRMVYFQYRNIKIPLKSMRDELKLMSTYFDIETNAGKDTVFFIGKGFGHGVGLSQEGAMKMANYGYKFDQIIQFYFKDIILIDKKKLNFFKEE